MAVFRLTSALRFPPPELADPDGLLAVGGDLSEARLLLAYRMGIFPWYGEGEPILWWSPDPRLILLPDELRINRSLRRVLRKGGFEVTFDAEFPRVIEACAQARGPGRSSTWITPEMIRAYGELHRQGYAHSVESRQDGRLVGGLYGVSLGGCFFGESMFSREPNASKVALVALVHRLWTHGCDLIDCQVPTAHLEGLGARAVSRTEFLTRLARSLACETRQGPWGSNAAPQGAGSG